MATLSTLRTRTRYYLDDDSGTRWGDAEVNYYINQAYRYYYNILVDVGYDGILSATPASLNITANVDYVALPSDFYKGKRLFRVFSSYKVPMPYVENYETTIFTSGSMGYYVPHYEFRGAFILLKPTPDTSYTAGLELDYWPVMTELSSDSDSPVTSFTSQWQDMIPIRAAYIAKSIREEEDVANIQSFMMDSEMPFKNTIEQMTTARQGTEPFCTGG